MVGCTTLKILDSRYSKIIFYSDNIGFQSKVFVKCRIRYITSMLLFTESFIYLFSGAAGAPEEEWLAESPWFDP